MKSFKYILGKHIELDSNQIRIVTSNAKHIMVYAGAGTGKSTTIVARIKYLIEIKKVDPQSILVLSYTNETVKDLQCKCTSMIHAHLHIMTFHRFSLSLYSNKEKYSVVSVSEFIIKHLEDIWKNAQKRRLYLSLLVDYIEGPAYFLYFVSFDFYKRYIYKKNRVEDYYKKMIPLLENALLLIKQKQYSKEKWGEWRKQYQSNNRELLKINLLEEIYDDYCDYLDKNHLIDFEDMITKGTFFIDKQKSGFSYVIVDEYQDISFNRFLLFYKYITKFDCNTMVVGDDFQSIFSFAGSDVSYFVKFTEYMKNVEQYYITKTYRNSQELIGVAGSFVMKNKEQISKRLLSEKHESKPIILFEYKNKRRALKQCIDEIIVQYGSCVKIMLLGRYKHDLDFIKENDEFFFRSKDIYYKKRNISISFLTVHASKGLEADVVILINTDSGLYGFPSEVSSFFSFLTDAELYPYAEERRLFYVALTRCRIKVYLMVSKQKKSVFVDELKKDYPSHIAYLHDS